MDQGTRPLHNGRVFHRTGNLRAWGSSRWVAACTVLGTLYIATYFSLDMVFMFGSVLAIMGASGAAYVAVGHRLARITWARRPVTGSRSVPR